jgi:mRNA interferase MazF
MTRLFVICEQWDVVVVPFPFTEKSGTKRRPAVVLSKKAFNSSGHTALLMITTKSHAPWPGDTAIDDPTSAGLAQPCLVRLKLFTLDNRLLVKQLGALASSDHRRLLEQLHRYFLE